MYGQETYSQEWVVYKIQYGETDFTQKNPWVIIDYAEFYFP